MKTTEFASMRITAVMSIVWNSCRAHISKRVKDHCRSRGIEKMIVIPGSIDGMYDNSMSKQAVEA
jgi:hypothetical protein